MSRSTVALLLLAACAVENPDFVDPLPFADELAANLSPSAAVVSTEPGDLSRPSFFAWPLNPPWGGMTPMISYFG